MTARIDHQKQSPELFRKLAAFSLAFEQSPLEQSLRDLVEIRSSQMNGCAFCLDIHVKAATKHGERPLRLHHIAVWRESPLFSPRERAVLMWTEMLTDIPADGVNDDAYEKIREQLSEKELADLTYFVAAINAWNRLNIAFQTPVGSADKASGVDGTGLT